MLLAGELEVSRDEDDHSAGGAGGLAIDGGNLMLALLEGKTSELGDDVGGSHDLLALEGEHGAVLVEVGEAGTIGIEGGVVVLDECLGDRVWIHRIGGGWKWNALFSHSVFSSLLYASQLLTQMSRYRERGAIFSFFLIY